MTSRIFKRTSRRAARGGWSGRLRSEAGFTIIEALVAATILVVGLLTTFLMLVASTHASASVRARQGAVTLARQITDDARSISFSQVSSSTIVTTLQGMPGLANSSTGSSWQIVRNGVTYTITVGVTPIYDTKDPNNGSSSTTVDFQQVSVTVSWNLFFQKITHQVTETTMISRAGQDPGLIASGLQLASAGPVSTYGGTATAPVINNSSTTSLTFSVTAPTGTSAIVWSLNGGKQASWAGPTPSSGTTWTSSAWSISGVSDGIYTVTAQAEDAYGVDGPATAIQVRLIRNVPSAPSVTGYGFNSNFMVAGSPTTVAEIQWNSNPELNVVGYRITSGMGSTCQTSTTSFSATACSNWWCSSPTACVDLNPPATSATSSQRTYSVQALYYDSNNVLQYGNATNINVASGTPSPPNPVPLVNLTVVTQPDNTGIITWNPPVGGTAVSFYRIYRDGSNYGSRYDVLPASSCSVTCTYHDTNRTTTHSYYITAVGGTSPGSNMAESQATGPVSG